MCLCVGSLYCGGTVAGIMSEILAQVTADVGKSAAPVIRDDNSLCKCVALGGESVVVGCGDHGVGHSSAAVRRRLVVG